MPGPAIAISVEENAPGSEATSCAVWRSGVGAQVLLYQGAIGNFFQDSALNEGKRAQLAMLSDRGEQVCNLREPSVGLGNFLAPSLDTNGWRRWTLRSCSGAPPPASGHNCTICSTVGTWEFSSGTRLFWAAC